MDDLHLTRADIVDWIQDLRSGEYAQCTGQLCGASTDNSYSYCCLGVLHRVTLARTGFRHVTNTFGLPDHWSQRLVRLNDTERWTFQQIADELETNLLPHAHD